MAKKEEKNTVVLETEQTVQGQTEQVEQEKVDGLALLAEKLAEQKVDREKERKLEEEISGLEKEIEERRRVLSEKRRELAELRRGENAKEREKAVRLLREAARLMGVLPECLGLPEAEKKKTEKKRAGGKTSSLRVRVNGKLYAEDSPGTVIAHHTAGCGGTKKDGRLSVDELVTLVGGWERYSAGGWKVTLPNGKVLEGVMVGE